MHGGGQIFSMTTDFLPRGWYWDNGMRIGHDVTKQPESSNHTSKKVTKNSTARVMFSIAMVGFKVTVHCDLWKKNIQLWPVIYLCGICSPFIRDPRFNSVIYTIYRCEWVVITQAGTWDDMEQNIQHNRWHGKEPVFWLPMQKDNHGFQGKCKCT